MVFQINIHDHQPFNFPSYELYPVPDEMNSTSILIDKLIWFAFSGVLYLLQSALHLYHYSYSWHISWNGFIDFFKISPSVCPLRSMSMWKWDIDAHAQDNGQICVTASHFLRVFRTKTILFSVYSLS